jgi:hypothetical protein
MRHRFGPLEKLTDGIPFRMNITQVNYVADLPIEHFASLQGRRE